MMYVVGMRDGRMVKKGERKEERAEGVLEILRKGKKKEREKRRVNFKSGEGWKENRRRGSK